MEAPLLIAPYLIIYVTALIETWRVFLYIKFHVQRNAYHCYVGACLNLIIIIIIIQGYWGD